MTGGMEGEKGDGSRRQVRPGDVCFGEDTTGQGHITPTIATRPRFSIFAFLVKGRIKPRECPAVS